MKPPVVEKFGKIFVVRDDLIAGGTKARVIRSILESPTAQERVARGMFDPPQNRGSFVYASPVYGYAQIAIAIGCKRLGKQAHIFVAERKRSGLHPRTEEARKAGAVIHEIPFGYLSNVSAKAAQFAAVSGATLLPFGLNCPELRDGLAAVARGMNLTPREVWCVAGSGTLSRALQTAWPKAEHHAVRVGARDTDIGRAIEHIAPEPFARDAKAPPPFPSVSNYDAKGWQFVSELASPGAVFWNVAG